VREPHRGYGRACAAGLRALRADTEIVCFLDGDGSDVPDFLPAVVRPVAEGEADFVMGSRLRGRREPGSMTPQQLVAGWLAGVIVKGGGFGLIGDIVVGIVGAFFSALTRLHRVDHLPQALMSDTVLGLNGVHLVVYSIVPPVVGAIAALVLYVGFISGIFESGVFPKLVCKAATKTCNDLVQVLNDYGPDKAADYGKALVWSFFAGFAERLVPHLRSDGRVVLVLGSEGKGLRPRVRAACDALVELPLLGKIGSLNVSATAAALLYEVMRQRAKPDA